MKLLKNNGKRRLGIPGRPAIILSPGDSVPVTEEQIEEMRQNKTVDKWLERGVLSLVKPDDVKPEPTPAKVAIPKRPLSSRLNSGHSDKREKVVLPDGVTGEGTETHHKGGGWYEVYVNGFKVTDSNVRKDVAQEIAAEYEK